MLRNYLLIAYRNLLLHKSFSLLNILGLAMGMAASLMILQYICFEKSYDSFHNNNKDIYRVTKMAFEADKLVDHSAMTFTGTGPDLKDAFPEVKEVTTASPMYGNCVVKISKEAGESVSFLEENVFFADSNFLEVFSFPLLNDLEGVNFEGNDKVLLTESTAKKYFNNENPIGKSIEVHRGNQGILYKVTGVLKDIPLNSHLQFDMVLSSAYQRNWNNFDFYTYLLLNPGADPIALENKFPQFLTNIFLQDGGTEEDAKSMRLELQKITDIHLYSNIRNEAGVNGNARSVYFLGIIALMVICIAWVNYVNLATAKAIERAKEVGIRKVSGANRNEIIKQFLLESFLLNLIGLLVAVSFAQLISPIFNYLTGKPLGLGLIAGNYLLLFIFLFLLGSLLSGLYPAFVLSAFKPISVLKGKLKSSSSGLALRKSLVVFQFAASVTLIAGTLVVFHQLEYMRNKELGMNIDQVLVLKAPYITDSTYFNKAKYFKSQLTGLSSVKGVTISDAIPGKEIWSKNQAFREGFPEETVQTNEILVDDDFIESYELKILAGRNFSEENKADTATFILNETVAKSLNFLNPQDALNRIINFRGNAFRVIGVVKDFNQESLRTGYKPIIFRMAPVTRDYYSIKVDTENLKETMASINNLWDITFSGNPFEYFFLDEFFARQYHDDQQFGRIFVLFALLTVFVACLGLFGLSSLVTVQRKKEIGIRKTLGASIGRILVLISKDFILLVIISSIIAIPLAWYLADLWLQNYAFHVEISWWFFVIPGLIVLTVATLTVSLHSWRAANANPISSLRYE